jgi:hypothetical protein
LLIGFDRAGARARLGVFTILVLVRESVKQLFGANPPMNSANVHQKAGVS